MSSPTWAIQWAYNVFCCNFVLHFTDNECVDPFLSDSFGDNALFFEMYVQILCHCCLFSYYWLWEFFICSESKAFVRYVFCKYFLPIYILPLRFMCHSQGKSFKFWGSLVCQVFLNDKWLCVLLKKLLLNSDFLKVSTTGTGTLFLGPSIAPLAITC